jgi:hypothetical protein
MREDNSKSPMAWQVLNPQIAADSEE